MSGNVMIHFQPERHNQLRRACDKCHRSKSKCVRYNDDEPCQRCLRANVECVSSPPASRRQAHDGGRSPTTSAFHAEVNNVSQTGMGLHNYLTKNIADNPLNICGSPIVTNQSSLLTVDTHMDVDSNFQLDNETSISRTTAKAYPAAGSSTVDPYQPSSTEESSSLTQEPANDLINLLQKLSDLNVNLMRHLAKIPEISANGTGSNSSTLKGDNPFSIDQIFHLSQIFIDVIIQICSGLPPSHEDYPEQITGVKRSTLFCLDPASELLIFSTYLRLIEMNDRILRLMKISIENKELNSPARYPFQVPDLIIGSFSLSSKTDTRSILLVNIMDTMISQAREAVAEATTPKQTLGYRGDFQSFGGVTLVIVPDLARSAIRVREDALVGLVKDLKKSVLQSGK